MKSVSTSCLLLIAHSHSTEPCLFIFTYTDNGKRSWWKGQGLFWSRKGKRRIQECSDLKYSHVHLDWYTTSAGK